MSSRTSPLPCSVTLVRNSLGGMSVTRGRHAKAEPVFLRVLAMYQRLQGADHPDVGRTLSNLGVVYYGLASMTRPSSTTCKLSRT